MFVVFWLQCSCASHLVAAPSCVANYFTTTTGHLRSGVASKNNLLLYAVDVAIDT